MPGKEVETMEGINDLNGMDKLVRDGAHYEQNIRHVYYGNDRNDPIGLVKEIDMGDGELVLHIELFPYHPKAKELKEELKRLWGDWLNNIDGNKLVLGAIRETDGISF